ncbi:MAG: hypothetical protein SFV52_06210 [Saprospiraceae bacterium]|nr:hypothetical protein [Saprospiraceae bacterium]
MLSIYASTELLPTIREYIAGEERLDELVEVHDFLTVKPVFSAFHFMVRPKQGITHPIDWYNVLPPYLLPEEIPFSRENLLGLVFSKLGNGEKMHAWLAENPSLLHELDILSRLQHGIPVDAAELHSDFQPFEEYRFCHNAAVVHHYASEEQRFDPEKTEYFYREAVQNAPNGEYAAFSARQYALFLIDLNALDGAEEVLQQAIPFVLSDEAALELRATLCQVWMKKLTVPYDPALLERLKTNLWDVLEHYRRLGRDVEEGLTLIDAAQIAHYADSFAEALGYINRAVSIFRQEQIPELLAQAHHRRALLLYTWAKNGSPQFFKGALESFKEALKVFNREDAPEVFAEMQQYLGIIYAEMPDETLKRGVWAALSASAFQEALAFFAKDRHPYEYAMVCNHYGNALTKYPPAVHSDNIEKALFYYNEALGIRRADRFPLERATTLLNFVEACWHLNLEGKGANTALFEEMVAKTNEALHLSDDPHIRDEAHRHLERLESLRAALQLEGESMPDPA